MTRVTCDIGVSVDGFSAGFDQTEHYPMGFDGETGWHRRLHQWMFETPEENQLEIERILEAKAYIMGRNMFTPFRGEWDREWTGWWGDEPPYHAPVFVLTSYPREPLSMAGGTTFSFVTDGIESAYRQACEAAGNGPVSIGGGATTVNQFLAAGLIDELRLHIAPFTMGAGTRLFENVPPQQLQIIDSRSATEVTHLTYHVIR